MKRIPIKAGKAIADEYGYDQVIIIARKVGENGGEHCTTYGVNKQHCAAAAKIGDFLKFKVMGWVNAQTPPVYKSSPLIENIKAHRAKFGSTLIEAKSAVEAGWKP